MVPRSTQLSVPWKGKTYRCLAWGALGQADHLGFISHVLGQRKDRAGHVGNFKSRRGTGFCNVLATRFIINIYQPPILGSKTPCNSRTFSPFFGVYCRNIILILAGRITWNREHISKSFLLRLYNVVFEPNRGQIYRVMPKAHFISEFYTFM